MVGKAEGMPCHRCLGYRQRSLSDRYLSLAEQEEIALGAGTFEVTPCRRSLASARAGGIDNLEELRRNACHPKRRPRVSCDGGAFRGAPGALLAAQSGRSLRATHGQEFIARGTVGWRRRGSEQGSCSRRSRVLEKPSARTTEGQATRKQRLEPEQIARRLPVDFPDDATMRISHEAIYQALFVQGRGALRRELTACLRTGRVLRMPRAHARGRGEQDLHLSRDHDQPTSGGGSRSRRAGPLGRRPYPGSWQFGDQHLGRYLERHHAHDRHLARAAAPGR